MIKFPVKEARPLTLHSAIINFHIYTIYCLLPRECYYDYLDINIFLLDYFLTRIASPARMRENSLFIILRGQDSG